MDKTTLLIVAEPATPDAEIKAMIEDLPVDKYHVALLVAGAAPPFPAYAYAAQPYGPGIFPEDWQQSYQEAAQHVTDRGNALEQLLQKAGLEGDVTTIFCEPALLDDEVAVRAQLADFVFLPPSLNADAPHFDQIVAGLIYESPPGLIVNAANTMSVLAAKRPFVAWDSSLPATRAVHRALPILRRAQEVTVAVIDPRMKHGEVSSDPGVDLAAWLTRHGCKVTVQQYPGGGRDVATAIRAEVTETGSDLLVMGAYARSRARQLLLGGTTQSMLAQSDVPVFLVH
ncbi:universal stress protein [Aestuariicoccus sp. MJ-SS9]|uniref:universal stress protein n=1 Tax=Aestuariicoccus sp. MJ-SS9 TaxID=3079855 RepID=UPI00290A1F93|nr:universal stress protein [Aestuariicoccus sp. MJ-SS9]MDU8911616.1 universal stress protein [Aestuariicoccus sp. MJ-SS9]